MSLGKNLQYLRKQKKISQEELAEKMSVSRQTVSKWEADSIVPELSNLTRLSDLFSCKLDALVREDLADCDGIYSDVTVKTVKGFSMARYVMVTPNPENDVNRYMEEWAKQSGLLALHPDAEYAVITVIDPFAAAFERIPNGYKKILDFLQANGFQEKPQGDIVSCFEYVYEKDGKTCMDIHVHTDSVNKTKALTNFS